MANGARFRKLMWVTLAASGQIRKFPALKTVRYAGLPGPINRFSSNRWMRVPLSSAPR